MTGTLLRGTISGPERMCVGMGDADQMSDMARRIRRSPVLGCGVALTDREHPLSMEHAHGDLWHLYAWVDRDLAVPKGSR